MNRRTAIKLLGGLAVGSSLEAEWVQNPYVNSGALRPKRTKDRKHFHRVYPVFRGASNAVGNVFLYRNLQKQLGEVVPHDQGEGRDCVAHAAAMGCDVLAATNIHQLDIPERWVAKASVEMLYAGSRIEVGQYGRLDENPRRINWLAGRGGSFGEWAARWVKEYGVLHRIEYQHGQRFIDLGGYQWRRSQQYRDVGVPDWLEPFARQHPVQEITNVHTGQEALDAVCAGQPVVICSSYAVDDKRDSDGFSEVSTGRKRRLQYHARVLTGAILQGRVGGVLQDSHGDWNSGPRPHGIPVGAFAVDLAYLNMMIQDWYGCYALASYQGHQAAAIKHRLYLR